jgi:hypothetical protein
MLLREYIPALRYGAKLLATDVSGPNAIGNVWYVNGCNEGGFANGNDANAGDEIGAPLATIKAALAKCINYHNDYIVVLDYWQPSGETFPIDVNVDTVNIVSLATLSGFPMGGPMIPWAIIYTLGNYAAMDINANNVFIQGFQFYAGSASYPCITFNGKGFIHIDKCRFNVGNYGILSESGGEVDVGLSVTDCYFQNGLGAGIYLNSDPAHCYIARNHFDRLTGVAISVVGGAGTVIEDNTIALNGDTSGLAITLGAGVTRATVARNYCGYGEETGAAGAKPYKDSSTITGNAWMMNYYGSVICLCD